MAKTDIDTEINLTLNFFTELGRYDKEEYLCMFKGAYFDPNSMQSLKATSFVDSGE